MGTAVVVFALLVLLFSTFARQLGRWNISAPIAFVVAGAILGFSIGGPTATEVLWVKAVTEITLALVLFHDAAQVRPHDLNTDRVLLLRMMGLAFPLTIILGYLLARWLFPDLPVMLALLIATALAPTDAGLGAPTIMNRIVPVRVRRLLNEEGGFNDGLATPLALFAIAALAGTEGLRPAFSVFEAVAELVIGAGFGAFVGAAAAVALGLSRAAEWSTSETRALAVATLPLLAYGGAELLHGQGFVAAFMAGTALVGLGRWTSAEHSALHLTEVLTGPLGFAVWCVFGLVAVPRLWGNVGWREWLFALLSLTVLRMVPMAVALVGSGFRAGTVIFLGWFGPRGLVSVLFALKAVDSLISDDELRQALRVILLTVALSVLAHGLSATPLAERYGRWIRSIDPPPREMQEDEHSDFAPQPRGSLLRTAEHERSA